MEVTSGDFKRAAREALINERLQRALGNVSRGFPDRRARAIDALPEYAAISDHVTAMRDHVIAHLDTYLEAFEARVTESGGRVHWAADAAEACAAVTDICRRVGARTVAKGKSMATEEIGLNEHLANAGFEPIETDLGEYILQLRGDRPSHIIAPAIHLMRGEVNEAFAAHHDAAMRADSDDPEALQAEARRVLRQQFLAADVGITGSNVLIAETGSTCTVTNEGNGDLVQCLPRVHVVVAGIDKVLPTLDDASALLRLLARSATGQDITVYTTFATGPKRPDDAGGPEEFHVVLLDNGRSDMVGGPLQSMLRCIRCGACMNHCPVYGAVGGHAYGWVYPGPMGAVLTPQIAGLKDTADLPNASTFCGRCAEVCPVQIPLPDLMRHWREREYETGQQPQFMRWGLTTWARFARQPTDYRRMMRLAARVLRLVARGRSHLRRLPFAGGWTRTRDLPLPAARGFLDQWRERDR